MLYCISAVIVAAAVILDQIVKHLISAALALGETLPLLPGVLRLTLLHNYGAAFSIFVGHRWPLVLLTVAFFVLVAVLLGKKIVTGKAETIALAMVFGGALGNLIDRLRFGYVVDMFETEFMSFPVFNVADIFVVCGGILFCIAVFLHEEKQEKSA